MGWFWATSSPRQVAPVAPHPIPSSDDTPPPGCPMHRPNFSPSSVSPSQDNPSQSQSSCPARALNSPNTYLGLSSSDQSINQHSDAPQIEGRASPKSTLSKLNPLNYMPSSISNTPSNAQSVSLPLEREVSSIPRGDADSNWEYPSPQQMYNAMLRKGYTDTPADAVESMVAVHNFLNEGAWQEIIKWEHIFSKGLGPGWRQCKRGEENLALSWAKAEASYSMTDDPTAPRLLRFVGRPSEPTPKARILQALGYVYPSGFGSEPPFDRHDWFVSRRTPTGQQQEVRYVIDYYSGPPESTGEPVFYLDIRPAVDRPMAAVERLMRWGGDVWYRASGGSVREGVKS